MSKDIKISSNRSFGIVFFVVFLLIGLYPLLNGDNIRIWSLILAIIFIVLGIVNSKLLSPINLLWFKFGILLGRFISPIVMGIIFFLVVTPTAFILRLFGKDVLNLKKNNEPTYWIENKDKSSRMKNQFLKCTL